MPYTLVTFHAHPDDESLLTAGTMAKAAAEGHRVVLVVATRGEVGDVSSEFLGDDELGRRRTTETERSAEALGVHRLEFLGYHDSGSDPDHARSSGGFSTVPVDQAAQRLAEILREERADVLTTYDPTGGYGHPDHLQVHRVGARAGKLAGTPSVLEATFDRDLLLYALELLPTIGLDIPDSFVPPDVSSWFVPGAETTHEIDVSAHLAAKRTSMEAHASQTTSDVDTVRNIQLLLAIPDEWFAVAFGKDWYIDRSLASGSRPPGEKITDVFAAVAG